MGAPGEKTRKLIDKAYDNIIKSMIEGLNAIAGQVDQEAKTESEEREYLNVQIVIVGKPF